MDSRIRTDFTYVPFLRLTKGPERRPVILSIQDILAVMVYGLGESNHAKIELRNGREAIVNESVDQVWKGLGGTVE